MPMIATAIINSINVKPWWAGCFMGTPWVWILKNGAGPCRYRSVGSGDRLALGGSAA
jgi:hypothetical protein